MPLNQRGSLTESALTSVTINIKTAATLARPEIPARFMAERVQISPGVPSRLLEVSLVVTASLRIQGTKGFVTAVNPNQPAFTR